MSGAFRRTTVMQPPSAFVVGTSYAFTASGADSYLELGVARIFPQHRDRYDPDDPQGQLALITALSGDNITATLLGNPVDGLTRTVKGGYWILMLQDAGVYPTVFLGQTDLQAALDALVAGGALVAAAGSITLTSGLNWPEKDDLYIDLRQLKIVGPSLAFNGTMLTHTSISLAGPTTLDTQVNRGAGQAVLTAGGVAALGLAAGDLIAFVATQLTQWFEVGAVPVGETVQLADIAVKDFATGANTAVYNPTYAKRNAVYLWLDGNNNTGHIVGFDATGHRDSYIYVKGENFAASGVNGGAAVLSSAGYNNAQTQ